jgi:hypothetical protein
MPYATTPPNTWRWIDSIDDLLPGETYSETRPDTTTADKRDELRLTLDNLTKKLVWILLPDSPIKAQKKQAFAQYLRTLRRLDLTDPYSVIFPDDPGITMADFQPTAADDVRDGAMVAAQNIPGWASWPETQANT